MGCQRGVLGKYTSENPKEAKFRLKSGNLEAKQATFDNWEYFVKLAS